MRTIKTKKAKDLLSFSNFKLEDSLVKVIGGIAINPPVLNPRGGGPREH